MLEERQRLRQCAKQQCRVIEIETNRRRADRDKLLSEQQQELEHHRQKMQKEGVALKSKQPNMGVEKSRIECKPQRIKKNIRRIDTEEFESQKCTTKQDKMTKKNKFKSSSAGKQKDDVFEKQKTNEQQMSVTEKCERSEKMVNKHKTVKIPFSSVSPVEINCQTSASVKSRDSFLHQSTRNYFEKSQTEINTETSKRIGKTKDNEDDTLNFISSQLILDQSEDCEKQECAGETFVRLNGQLKLKVSESGQSGVMPDATNYLSHDSEDAVEQGMNENVSWDVSEDFVNVQQDVVILQPCLSSDELSINLLKSTKPTSVVSQSCLFSESGVQDLSSESLLQKPATLFESHKIQREDKQMNENVKLLKNHREEDCDISKPSVQPACHYSYADTVTSKYIAETPEIADNFTTKTSTKHQKVKSCSRMKTPKTLLAGSEETTKPGSDILCQQMIDETKTEKSKITYVYFSGADSF